MSPLIFWLLYILACENCVLPGGKRRRALRMKRGCFTNKIFTHWWMGILFPLLRCTVLLQRSWETDFWREMSRLWSKIHSISPDLPQPRRTEVEQKWGSYWSRLHICDVWGSFALLFAYGLYCQKVIWARKYKFHLVWKSTVTHWVSQQVLSYFLVVKISNSFRSKTSSNWSDICTALLEYKQTFTSFFRLSLNLKIS